MQATGAKPDQASTETTHNNVANHDMTAWVRAVLLSVLRGYFLLPIIGGALVHDLFYRDVCGVRSR